VYPQQYAIKEKEAILFFEAKKKFFLAIHNKNAGSFSAEDSGTVDKLSIKDSLFVHYLKKQIKIPLLFTIQEKCAQLIDAATINNKLNQLNKERENTFMLYFKNRELGTRVKIQPVKNVIPFNGFSFYEIGYNGEFPESLINAYRKMNELNESSPRKKFKKERGKKQNQIVKKDPLQ
jgi:hypothetical protein